MILFMDGSLNDVMYGIVVLGSFMWFLAIDEWESPIWKINGPFVMRS